MNLNKIQFDPSFWVYLRFINKWWSYALIGFVLIFHFVFDTFGATDTSVFLWAAAVSIYLIFLLLARKFRTYDGHPFRLVRILSNVFFISWLIIISPNIQSILWILYIIPITVAWATFDKIRWTFLILILSLVGLSLSTLYIFGAHLSFYHFGVIAVLLSGWTFLYYLAEKYLSINPINEHAVSKKRQKKNNVIKNAMQKAKQLSNADRVLMIVIHPEKKYYIAHESEGFEDFREGQSIDKLAKKCSVLQTGEPFQTTNVLEEFKKGTIYNRFFTCDPQSILAEPLFSKDGKAAVGVLTVSHDKTNAFDRLARIAIRTFALELGPKIEDFIDLHQQRISKARNVGSGGGFAKAENENDIAEVLMKEAKNQFGIASGIVLHRYDVAQNELIPWKTSYTQTDLLVNSPMKPGKGVAGQVFTLEEPILISDVHKHPWFEKSKQLEKFESLLTIPLIVPKDNSKYGTLSIHRKHKEAFDSEDEQYGVRLCTQASIAIRRLKQLEETKGYADRLQRILDNLPSFDQYNHESEQEFFYNEIVKRASEILDFEAVIFHLLDPITKEYVSTAAEGIPPEAFAKIKGKRTPVKDWDPFIKEEFKIGHRTYFVPSNSSAQDEISEDHFYTFPSGNTDGWHKDNVLFALLETDGHHLGRLAFDLPKSGHAPSPELINAIDVFSSMIIWALERQVTNKRRRDILISISNGLAESEDWDTVGDLVVYTGASLLDAEGCTLYQVLDNEIRLTHSNYQSQYLGKSKPLSSVNGCGLAAWVATTGEIICSNNGEYKNHPAWAGSLEHLQLLGSGTCRNLLIVPIRSALEETQIIGVLNFENKKEFFTGFDEDDKNLVQYMTRHIAIAKQKVDRKGMIETWERWGLEDDLHELLNWQSLGVVAHLKAVEALLTQKRYDKLHTNIPIILENARSAANEIKSIHSMTHSKYLEIKDIPEALETIRDMWVKRIDQEGRLSDIPVICNPELILPAPVRIVILKIASNALLNAIEYSGVLEDDRVQIKVSLLKLDDSVCLCVEDNGHGKDPLPKGYGITRMEQLVEQINQNGTIPYYLDLNLNSSPVTGTKVILNATMRQEI